MWKRVSPVLQPVFFSCSKRHHSNGVLEEKMVKAADLIRRKKYEEAQCEYQDIMKIYPNYAKAYDQYYRLQYKIIGPFGLTQDLFDHLQQKYLDAVKKYGEFSEEPNPTSTPKC